MLEALGIVETSSIGKGIELSDLMVKSAQINIEFASPVCPGKYLIIVSGHVGEVEESIKVIKEKDGNILNATIIQNMHKELLNGLNKKYNYSTIEALGILELTSIASALKALDTALKTAYVRLVKLRINTIGGKCYFIITGDVSSVHESLEHGVRVINNKKILSKVVIPSPDKKTIERLVWYFYKN